MQEATWLDDARSQLKNSISSEREDLLQKLMDEYSNRSDESCSAVLEIRGRLLEYCDILEQKETEKVDACKPSSVEEMLMYQEDFLKVHWKPGENRLAVLRRIIREREEALQVPREMTTPGAIATALRMTDVLISDQNKYNPETLKDLLQQRQWLVKSLHELAVGEAIKAIKVSPGE